MISATKIWNRLKTNNDISDFYDYADYTSGCTGAVHQLHMVMTFFDKLIDYVQGNEFTEKNNETINVILREIEKDDIYFVDIEN
jgi:hypothetical protein